MEITKQQLRKNMSALSPEENEQALLLVRKLGIDISEGDNRLTGTKPSGFTFEGRFYPSDHYRDIFLKVCEIAASRNPGKINLFFEIFGRKRKYFSRDYNELFHDCRRINGTDIYADLNANSTTLKKRSEQVIAIFGMNIHSFKTT